MKRSYLSVSLAAIAATSASAFSPPAFATRTRTALHVSVGMPQENHSEAEAPYFVSLKPRPPQAVPPMEAELQQQEHPMNQMVSEANVKKQPKKKPAAAAANGHSSGGVFAPVVRLAKTALGEEKLNKVRAKAISIHSDTISSFVDTSNTASGKAVLRALFEVADLNKNGKVEQEELEAAFRLLGFDWLQEKQVKGIFKRADTDEDGYIDMDEWMQEAPKTLRTNLIKLAKKNGGRLGFLA